MIDTTHSCVPSWPEDEFSLISKKFSDGNFPSQNVTGRDGMVGTDKEGENLHTPTKYKFLAEKLVLLIISVHIIIRYEYFFGSKI